MSGFSGNLSNLPPGVRESDLPGNRPEDQDAEDLCLKLDALAADYGIQWVLDTVKGWQQDQDSPIPQSER